MNETLEFIEAYFEKKLNNSQKEIFEQRCAKDENFAKEVAFYITSREAIRQTLLEQKKQLWTEIEHDTHKSKSNNTPIVKKINFQKWLPYAAAACLLISVAVYFLYRSETPQQLANNYVKQTLTQISQTMDGSKDSLQKGISFYNTKQYDSALQLFKNIYNTHPDNSDAKEYIGLVYLIKKDYENALMHFDELANKKLFSNAGVFLKAVTLLQRNEKGDKEAAKKLLQRVKDQQLEGKKEAEEWLIKW
ncbi:MAG: tetratricopeptide repeat protein [Ginsengibacter sp.]